MTTLYTRIPTALLLLVIVGLSSGCERAGSSGDEGPAALRILFDEGHHNYFTTHSTYRRFVEILRDQGYDVVPLTAAITQQALEGSSLFMTGNPFPQNRDSLIARARMDDIPFRWHPAVAAPAFTQEEASLLEAWVRDGGALLVFADHAPHGETLRPLVEPFGVELANVKTSDPGHADPRWQNPWWILFTRSDEQISPHPVTRGVDSVVTLLGQSIRGPTGSHPLLTLSSTALDWEYSFELDSLVSRSAAGRSQGVALEVDNGRVVVFGEGGMLTVELDSTSGEERFWRPGNLQLGLNAVAWLTEGHQTAVAQTYECLLHLEQDQQDPVFAGECTKPNGDAFDITLREVTSSDRYPWQGAFLLDDDAPPVAIDLLPPGLREGSRGVIRTPFGWFFLGHFEQSARQLSVSFSFDDDVPPSAVDLKIVQRAHEVLGDVAAWDRNDDRNCEPSDTAWSLYCALHRATIELTGEFHHRQPALQVVRRVVSEIGSDRISGHRLMDFNNHERTTLDEIHGVLDLAATRIEAGFKD